MIMPRVFCLKVQKVCMQYRRKFCCLTDDKYYSTVKNVQDRKNYSLPLLLLKTSFRKLRTVYIT